VDFKDIQLKVVAEKMEDWLALANILLGRQVDRMRGIS
jgi:hypothetical protein